MNNKTKKKTKSKSLYSEHVNISSLVLYIILALKHKLFLNYGLSKYCLCSWYQSYCNYLLALWLWDCFIAWSLIDSSFLIVTWISTVSYTFNNDQVLQHMIAYGFLSQSILLIQWNLQLCRQVMRTNRVWTSVGLSPTADQALQRYDWVLKISNMESPHLF